MVSRDMKVQAAAVAVAVLVLGVGALLSNTGTEAGPTPLLLAFVSYGIAFGGAHFYLALRGDDSLIPVRSRWRFVAMVLTVLGAVPIGVLNRTIGVAVAVLAIVIYFLVESIDGYRESKVDQH